MALGKNCGTCAHAEETDDNGEVTCTCEDSFWEGEVVSVKNWCKSYEEA